MAVRPSLLKMKVAFAKVNRDVSEVGTIIGGKVNHNINVLTPEQGRFENACAIRMSYALNYAGFKVPYIKNKTVSGGQGNWYIYRVKDLINFLYQKFGEPELVVQNPNANKLSEYKGILVVDVDTWLDASGHASIWTGSRCTDSCYFPDAKKAYLWKLED
ncbi:type VI secretion system amidase effector protein Tae4 [Vibrio campbellii]|uniref:type VI secretion system amidase effector protein Tae4 n=1 Tax=Vibrio harveyi group TaxID=717610 RepID=UPI00215BC461|nr:type VI secretion system amidase effector protein Tae4 [Vibrio campbellii]MCR9907696.1 type VI secretion system amidase effector protein Tae4 [Vibrio campbellii]